MSKPYVDRCFVSEDDRFVYLFMPRNGSQSFRQCGLFGSPAPRPEKYTDGQKNLIKIIILREPIERVISIFLYKFKKYEVIEPFKEFLNKITKSFTFVYSIGLWNPQYRYLSDKNLTLADIEEVFILENLNNDIKNFSTKYNLDLDIGHLNQSNRQKFDTLLQFINDNKDIKNTLTKLYSKDYELYNSGKTLQNK